MAAPSLPPLRRRIQIDISEPHFAAALAAYMAAVEGTVQDAIRDLCLQALAQNAADASIVAAYRRAYRDASMQARVDLADALNRMKAKLLGESEEAPKAGVFASKRAA